MPVYNSSLVRVRIPRRAVPVEHTRITQDGLDLDHRHAHRVAGVGVGVAESAWLKGIDSWFAHFQGGLAELTHSLV